MKLENKSLIGSPMNKTTRLILSLLISAVCLYFAFRNFSVSDLKESFLKANWLWFVPAMALHLIAMAGRVLRWQILLSSLGKAPYKDVFVTLTFGFFVNNILPARMGELVRAYASKKLIGIPATSSLGTIAVERLTDLLGVLVMIFLGLYALPMRDFPVKSITIALVLGIALLVMMFWFFETKGDALKSKLPGIWRKLIDIIHNITKGFAAIKSIPKIIAVILISILVWSIEATNLFLVSRAFQLDISFFEAAAVLVGLAIGVAIPAAPGYVGTYEFFGKEVLMRLGYAPGPALSYILAMHFYQLILNSLLGIPGFLKLGLSTKNWDTLKDSKSP
jgi:hypothetical protein